MPVLPKGVGAIAFRTPFFFLGMKSHFFLCFMRTVRECYIFVPVLCEACLSVRFLKRESGENPEQSRCCELHPDNDGNHTPHLATVAR